jgi:hypothetical protein
MKRHLLFTFGRRLLDLHDHQASGSIGERRIWNTQSIDDQQKPVMNEVEDQRRSFLVRVSALC